MGLGGPDSVGLPSGAGGVDAGGELAVGVVGVGGEDASSLGLSDGPGDG